MKRLYSTPTTCVLVFSKLSLLTVSNVNSNVNDIGWGGEDNTGKESDAPLFDF